MRFICLFLLILFSVLVGFADEADSYFDDSYVHEVRIYFENSDWYSVLYNSHRDDASDPYFPARFEYGDIVMDPVGVRFKGNSSFNVDSVKKSIKIDFDEYDESNDDLTFMGLKKLNFNNCFMDPTFLHEKLFLDFAAQFVPTIRAVHARVYINDVYWGLYSSVEQVDKTFARSRFDNDEDGNLFKGEADDEATGPESDFGSDLVWLGDDQESYYDHYQLKTNEDENDYSQLIEFIDVLNNSSTAELPEALEPIFDVRNCLMGLALNNLFVNLDAYNGSAHNYYLYDRDDTGKFTHIHWDTNETFGTFLMGTSGLSNPLQMDPFWLPTEDRPLMENLWAVEEYSDYYLAALALMLESGFDVTTMSSRIQELADIIRSDVYADNNKLYSNTQFETNLTSNVSTGGGPGGPGGGRNVYGLEYFVEQRANYLNSILEPLETVETLFVNEIMADNDATISDENGDYDDWVEIFNAGDHDVDLAGYFFTDGSSDLWQIPSGYSAETTVTAGGYIIVWFDKDSEDGPLHVEAKLGKDGEAVYLYAPDGVQLVDSYEFGVQYTDASMIRYADGTDSWYATILPTPGAPNSLVEAVPGCMDPEGLNYNPDANVNDGSCTYDTEPAVLFINEFMADNDAVIENPNVSGEYSDWLELYNPGDGPIDLEGMYLTDDLSDPTQWEIPAGVTIAAGDYLLFWADGNEELGGVHTSFKLGSSGEDIGLYDTDGTTLIDSITFGPQTTDVSFGRYPDGGETWGVMSIPTPGYANEPIILNLMGDAIYNNSFENGVASASTRSPVSGRPAAWTSSNQDYGDKVTEYYVDDTYAYEGSYSALLVTSGTPANANDLSIASLTGDYPVSLTKNHTYTVSAAVRRSHSQWTRFILFSAGFSLIHTESIDALDDQVGDSGWEILSFNFCPPSDIEEAYIRIDSIVSNDRTISGQECSMWVDDVNVIDLYEETFTDIYNESSTPQYGVRNRYFDLATETETTTLGGIVYTCENMPRRWNIAMAVDNVTNHASGYPIWGQETPAGLANTSGDAGYIKAKAADTSKPSWPAIYADGVRVNESLGSGERHILTFNYGAGGDVNPLLRVFMIKSDFSRYSSLFVDPSVGIPGNRMWPLSLCYTPDSGDDLVLIRFDNVTIGSAGSGVHADETVMYIDDVLLNVPNN